MRNQEVQVKVMILRVHLIMKHLIIKCFSHNFAKWMRNANNTDAAGPSNVDSDPVDSEDDSDNDEAVWSEPSGNQPILVKFMEHFGVNPAVALELPEGEPINFFQLLVDDAIFNLIADQTNLFSEQKLLSQDVTPDSRLHHWKPTSINEVKQFFWSYHLHGIDPYIKYDRLLAPR